VEYQKLFRQDFTVMFMVLEYFQSLMDQIFAFVKLEYQ